MKLEIDRGAAAEKPAEPLGFGPSILPVMELPDGVQGAYASGPDIRRSQGRTVAHAVRVRADCKIGDREFSAEINLHEVVLLRRYYEELGGGSVNINASWTPALRRIVPLDQEMLQTELARMHGSFVVPRPQGSTEIVPIYFGAEPTERLRRLHAIMKRQVEGWAELVKAADKRVEAKLRSRDAVMQLCVACEHITARELETIANMADPGYDGADAIELPGVTAPDLSLPPASGAPAATVEPSTAKSLDEVEAAINAQVDATPDPIMELHSRLMRQTGVTDSQALQLASLVELAEGVANVADDDIVGVLGSKAKLAAVKKSMKG